ncbi:MAG: hypothetical protein ACHQ53_11780 [Polyangiales bacterium]
MTASSARRHVALGAAALALLSSASGLAQTTDNTTGELSARHTDAHADRVLIVPTAETQPRGMLFGSSYEIVLLSAGYAPTDHVHVSVTGTTNFRSGFAELELKANVLRSRYLRIALQSSIDYLEGNEGAPLLFGRVGAIAQICFELACRSSLSLAAMTVVHDEPDTVLPVGLGAGFTARVSRDVSLLLEYSMLVNAARDLPLISLPVYVAGYGMRVSSHPSWALDVAFLRPMKGSTRARLASPTLFDLLGVPLLAFTYRGQP